MKVGLILNLKAKKIKEGKIKPEDLERILRNRKCEYKSRNVDYSLGIFYVLDEFRREGVEAIAFAGGDGTIHKSITDMIEFWNAYGYMPPICLLKCGTMNAIAKSMGFGDAYSTLEKLAKGEVEVVNVPIQKITLSYHDEKKIYGFIASGLAVVNFAQKYYDEKMKILGIKRPSLAKGIALFAKSLLSCIFNTTFYREIAPKTEMKMKYKKSDGNEDESSDYLNVFVTTTIPINIFGMKTLQNAKLDAEQKECLTFVTAFVDAKHVLKNVVVPRAFLGKKLDGIQHSYVKKLEISRADGKPFYVLVDGELYCCNKVSTELYQPIKMLRPLFK
jgi:diacylglycerol kinase family enzyme